MTTNIQTPPLAITPNSTVGFIGLGVMGGPMAGHLSKNFTTWGFNRSAEKAQAWHEHYPQAKLADTAQALASQCQAIGLCLGRDEDVRQMVQHILPHMAKGSVIVDHTTTSIGLAQEMEQLAATFEVYFLDCPVSGGQAGAQNGQLTIMGAGHKAAFDAAMPMLKAYSKMATHFGNSGNGQGVKMVNQILFVNVVQGLSEGICLAKQLGIDGDDLVNTLKLGAAGSWQLENRGPTMFKNEFDFGFAIDLALKDLGIVLDHAQAHQLDMPATSYIRQQYRLISDAGFGTCDTSALIKQFFISKK